MTYYNGKAIAFSPKVTVIDNPTQIVQEPGSAVDKVMSQKSVSVLIDCLTGKSLLDTVAYDGKTYREIFEYGNLIPDGDFENGLDFIASNTNGAIITDEVYNTSSHSLKCFGSSSVQIYVKVNVTAGNVYYQACKARIDRYVSGGGAGISSDLTNLSKVANNKFTTISGVYTSKVTNADVFIGTISASNCDAYIDDVVFIDLSALFGDTIPTVDEMNILYDKYLDIKMNWEKYVQADAAFIPITVEAQAYGGKSYKHIFEDSNLFDGGDFETSTLLDNAIKLQGSPTITETVSCTGSKSLMCSGTSSQHMILSRTLTAGEYFIAAMVKWGSREKGFIGIEHSLGGVYNNTASDDFTTLACDIVIETDQSVSFYIGTMGSASGTAYIDDVVLIKKDDVFGDMPFPTCGGMTQMYTTYIDIKRGKNISGERFIYRNTAVNAFLDAMRTKARDIGIVDIGYPEPHSNAVLSAKEMLSLGLEACSYTDLCRIWNKTTYAYATGNMRKVELISTVQNSTFEADYRILGGKTGSGNSGDPSYLLIVGENKYGTQYIGAVNKVINEVGVDHRWEAMKALFDIATAVEEDADYDLTSVTVPYATGAAICKLPTCNTALLKGHVDVIFAQNADEKNSIASVTKVLNACTALEFEKDLDTLITVTTDDAIEHSITKAGDILTIRELLHNMMLPSCNVAANTIARVVGEKIVNNYCDKFGIR